MLLLFMLLGCKSRPLGPYVSPRVTGQVIALDTGRPLAGVTVTRGLPDRFQTSPPKGAELLIRKPPIHTDENGRFELASERVLSVVRGAGWNLVSLSFESAGYLQFHTNCPVSAVTNTADGEPVLDVGRIALPPVPPGTNRASGPDSNSRPNE